LHFTARRFGFARVDFGFCHLCTTHVFSRFAFCTFFFFFLRSTRRARTAFRSGYVAVAHCVCPACCARIAPPGSLRMLPATATSTSPRTRCHLDCVGFVLLPRRARAFTARVPPRRLRTLVAATRVAAPHLVQFTTATSHGSTPFYRIFTRTLRYRAHAPAPAALPLHRGAAACARTCHAHAHTACLTPHARFFCCTAAAAAASDFFAAVLGCRSAPRRFCRAWLRCSYTGFGSRRHTFCHLGYYLRVTACLIVPAVAFTARVHTARHVHFAGYRLRAVYRSRTVGYTIAVAPRTSSRAYTFLPHLL